MKQEDDAYWKKERQMMRIAKKHCPSLEQQIRYMQYNPYAYPVNARQKIITDFQKYNCAQYISDVMNGIEWN